jgi:hypothetical protein
VKREENLEKDTAASLHEYELDEGDMEKITQTWYGPETFVSVLWSFLTRPDNKSHTGMVPLLAPTTYSVSNFYFMNPHYIYFSSIFGHISVST